MKREVKFIFLKGDEDMIDHIKCINELKCLYWTKGRKRFRHRRYLLFIPNKWRI